MRFTIHGVRGSVPTPGADFVKYGGNTSCFEIETSESQIFCDAGTGFRSAKLFRDQKDVSVFFTHFHHDHIHEGEALHFVFAALAGFSLAIGHWINLKLCKSCPSCKDGDTSCHSD